jgi:ribokinase
VGWAEDLGGMGAGFAAALGGSLYHALGCETDPFSRAIVTFLDREQIVHEPIRVVDHPADWTLVVTSGSHGDKLAIGFRGCHAALAEDAFDPWLAEPCDLRVAAGLPNSQASRVLRAPGAHCRLFAPAMRNMLDRGCPVSTFAGSIDVLCCNLHEWETLLDREETAWKVSILVVTEGSTGSWARFTLPSGDPGRVHIHAFPRARPPADTNRAGEAFAATFVSSLLSQGWNPSSGVAERHLVEQAMLRSSAAAALTIEKTTFGFPGPEEIDAALQLGRVP